VNQLSERYLEDFAVGQTFGWRLRIELARALLDRGSGSDETVFLGSEVGLKRIAAITDPGFKHGVRHGNHPQRDLPPVSQKLPFRNAQICRRPACVMSSPPMGFSQ
jgi:hypothetical protein